MRSLLALRVLAACLVLFVAAPAVANPGRAREHEEEGDKHFDLRRFEEALSAYRKAYDEHAAPRYLFRIGECYYNLDDPEKALFYFERYLSKKAKPPFRELVKERVAELRERLAETAKKRARQRLAVLPVDVGDRFEISDELTGLLWAGVDQLDRFDTLDASTMRDELDTATQMGVECTLEDILCLTKLTILMGVDALVVGRATGEQDTLELELAWIDARSGARLSQVKRVLSPPGPTRVVQVRELIELLLVPSARLGTLRIDATPAGARVLLDGDLVGTAPLTGPLLGVPVGTHQITVALDDERRQSIEVKVVAREEVAVRIDATVPPSTTPGPVGVVDRGGGGGGGLALAGGVVGGIGATALVVGAATALSIDAALLYSDVGESKDDRVALLWTERVFAGIGAAGAVMAVAGAGLWLAGASE
jgi:hypothetical protein